MAAFDEISLFENKENDVRSIAKARGCDEVEFRGRLGFEKIVKKRKGWKKQYTAFSMSIKDV